MKLEFARQIFEKLSNFMKIRPLDAEFFHGNIKTYGQKEEQSDRHDKANVVFRNFVNASNKEQNGSTCKFSLCYRRYKKQHT